MYVLECTTDLHFIYEIAVAPYASLCPFAKRVDVVTGLHRVEDQQNEERKGKPDPYSFLRLICAAEKTNVKTLCMVCHIS